MLLGDGSDDDLTVRLRNPSKKLKFSRWVIWVYIKGSVEKGDNSHFIKIEFLSSAVL